MKQFRPYRFPPLSQFVPPAGRVNGAGNAAADNRRRLYQQYCSMLGVTGCDQMLVCPPT